MVGGNGGDADIHTENERKRDTQNEGASEQEPAVAVTLAASTLYPVAAAVVGH